MLNILVLPSLRKFLFCSPFLLCPPCKGINLCFGDILTFISTNYLLLPLLFLPLPVPARPSTFWTSLQYNPSLPTTTRFPLSKWLPKCSSAILPSDSNINNFKDLRNPTWSCSALFPAQSFSSMISINTLKTQLLTFLDFQAHGHWPPETDLQERRCLPYSREYLAPDRLMTVFQHMGWNSISRLYHHGAVIKWISGKPGSLQCIKTVVLSLSMVMYWLRVR